MTPAEVALATVLVWIAVEDAVRFRIRNVAVLAVLGCMAAAWVVDRPPDLLAHLALGALALAVLLAAFARGWIGGGDAKLLVVALTFAGPGGAFVFALLLFAASCAYAAGARLGVLPSRRRQGRLQIPFGPAVAFAWIGFLAFR